ncbi:MAG TPA: FAD-dependent oxidoreductase [Polyangiales bacterium]|nr:FAD-dependent oxidoreductase [Polyangiales bacterium]
MPRIVVIGGVAAGTSAASQAKRRQPGAEVILLERGEFVSYGACGIPYNLQDPQKPVEALIAVSAERFRSERHIDLRLRQEVQAIDASRKRLQVQDRAREHDYQLDYDELVICTGAEPAPLPVPGGDLPGVFQLRELSDGARLKRFLAERAPRSALIVGAGYIGMELAETLRARGLEVGVLEKGRDVVPGFDGAIAELVRAELSDHGVAVETEIELQAIERSPSATAALSARTNRSRFEADLVLVAVGVRPNVALAKQAGVKLGQSGAIAVDDQQRTNLPGVWAAGDCAEARHVVSGQPVWIPLGTTANKQGKVAGANAAGGGERFAGVAGTGIFQVFELQVARTGLGPGELSRQGIDAERSQSTHGSRANSVQGGRPIRTVLFTQPDGRLLGAQMAGRDGVGGRIDVFATALHAGLRVQQIEGLDLAYAPPFAPVYDPIAIAATVAKKALAKRRPGA